MARYGKSHALPLKEDNQRELDDNVELMHIFCLSIATNGVLSFINGGCLMDDRAVAQVQTS